jgi:hypothetical protein
MLTRFLLVLILLITASGCCRDQDLPLSPALAAWIPYQSGQQITFRSSAGHHLVFAADLSRFNQEGSDKVCGAYDIETRQVNLTSPDDPALKVQITISHQILVGIRILRNHPPGREMDILFNTISENYVSDPYRDKFLKEATLNGKTYRDVLHAYSNPGAGPLSFTDLYYGKELGLVGFTLVTGETYSLE